MNSPELGKANPCKIEASPTWPFPATPARPTISFSCILRLISDSAVER